MPAYLIARVQTEQPSLLRDYLVATPPIVAQYRGRFLVRGGTTVTLEGPAETRRIVVLEFPTLADATAFHGSPEYTRARALRAGIAVAEFIAVDGIGPTPSTPLAPSTWPAAAGESPR